MAQFLRYDCTFKKQCTVPVTLTFEDQIFFVNWVHISILYKFQIDTHTDTDRVKTIPRYPLRGRGNNHDIVLFSNSLILWDYD